MAATRTLLYSRTEQITTATTYETTNKLRYNFLNDFISNIPIGWVLISSNIPVPSTVTMQGYSAIFEIDSKFRVQFRFYSLSDSAVTTNQYGFYIYIMDLNGAYILGDANTGVTARSVVFINSGMLATNTLSINIYEIDFPSYYKTYLVTSAFGSSRTFGWILLDEQNASNYPEVYFTTLYDAACVRLYSSSSLIYLTGAYGSLIKDGATKFEKVYCYLMNNGYHLLGVLKGCISDNAISSTSGEGNRIQVNSKSYHRATPSIVYLPEA